MSIVLVPGQFRADPHPVGKLASTLLSVTVAGMADPVRFRRGKGYVADGAVTRITLTPGQLVATVEGSRSHGYQVYVTVRTVERPDVSTPELLRAQINRLTPEGDDLMVSCTCPDDADPCKHAVAVILAFAAELVSRPELLVEWRCGAAGEAPARAQVGSRARGSERHLRLAPALPNDRRSGERLRTPEPPSPWESPEWAAFLGEQPPAEPVPPDEPVQVRRTMLGTIDLGAWVRSAIEELTGQQ
ncbi:MAG: SWIM zinc finger family protein [Actinomycetota bacterium]|nr:SWIM zinc finger family protein [Actinomycetota bacterium]